MYNILSISYVYDTILRGILQVVAISVLMSGYTNWILTKRFGKKMHGNYKRKLRAVLNKSKSSTLLKISRVVTYLPFHNQSNTRKILRGVLHLCRDAVGVFYSHSRVGKNWERERERERERIDAVSMPWWWSHYIIYLHSVTKPKKKNLAVDSNLFFFSESQ